MIKLHPQPDPFHHCPYCQILLAVKSWYIPGMRNMADLVCPQCNRSFYGDLPAGHGYDYPCLLDCQNGEVFGSHKALWFTTWLKDSWQNRSDIQLPVAIETFREIKRPILLNCLDTLYGHSVLKLLSAQYYIDQKTDLDLIILVPRFLRWMVPHGAAAVWTVDLPLRQGQQWNDSLAHQIRTNLERYDECWLSEAIAHPPFSSFEIERFTGVQPFDTADWEDTPVNPVVTLIWREDRLWNDRQIFRIREQLKLFVRQQMGRPVDSRVLQVNAYIQLLSYLREDFPKLDAAVVGIGTTEKFPDWIQDQRVQAVNPDTERAWCVRYAKSHLVIGVHGSNILLPSAHAATVIDLMPVDRWGNFAQDILMDETDSRMFSVRCRFLPAQTPIWIVAAVAKFLLRHFSSARNAFAMPIEPYTYPSSDIHKNLRVNSL